MTLDRRQILAGLGAVGAASASPRVFAYQPGGPAPDLSGRSVLITGASSGFGRLGAEHYARLGAKVFATMRGLPRPEADELRRLATDEKLDIEVIEIDVRDEAQVTAGVAQALKATGGTLDALVNNAGIAVSGPIEVQDMEAMRLAFETNVFGPHLLARAVLPAMRRAGSGHLVQVSSQLGRLVIPGFGPYSSTKFALEALSEQMAYETASHGIGVTIIQPGGYPTDIWENAARYSGDLKDRADDPRLSAYPQMTAGMGEPSGGGGGTDPMDVPRAIAEVIAAPLEERPLRLAVHPGAKPQLPINEASAEAQRAFPGGEAIEAVLAREKD